METYEVAVPITMSVADFRASVKLVAPREIEESGKIYIYEDYIFINDKMKGILIVDNTYFDPEKISYIEIPQNTDFAVKDDVLYANSGMDMVTFDIRDIHNIKIKERLENVFEFSYPELPASVQYADLSGFNQNETVILGYTTEIREVEMRNDMFFESNSDIANNSSENTGAGAMARFNIAGDYLYTVGRSELNVFDISNLSSATKLNSEYVGWQIETIFNKAGYLYLGSAAGMFIYSIEDPSAPTYVSDI